MVFIQEREESVVDFNVRPGDAEILGKPRPAPAKRQVHNLQYMWNPRTAEAKVNSACSSPAMLAQ